MRKILKRVYITDGGETVTSSETLHKSVDDFLYTEEKGSKEWKIKHRLETTGIVYSLFDELNRVIYPDSFQILNSNEVIIKFSKEQRGKVLIIGNVVE